MASKQSRKSRELTISNLSKMTKLSREDVSYLMKRFQYLCTKDSEKLHRDEFREELNAFFNITDDTLMDRVYRAFDVKSAGTLRVEDYVIGMGKFLNGTDEDHIQLCFDVYDMNNDGFISREDMFQLLKSCLVKAPSEEDPDEMVKELIEIVMKKMDCDHDGRVSIADFKVAVAEEKLLLEALGKCLPDKKCCMSFLDMVRMFGGGDSSSCGTISISQQKEIKRKGGRRHDEMDSQHAM